MTGIVFGLAPAFQTPERDAARGAEGRQPRLHGWPPHAGCASGLVVSEIAFACVLLVGAGLLLRSFIRVLDVDLGFRPSRAMTIRVDPDASYSTPERKTRVLRRGASPRSIDPRR